MTDTESLKMLIKNQGVSITHVAKALNISREGLYKKLNGETEFKASEIGVIRKLLRMTPKEFDSIFFANDGELNSAK